MMTPETIEQIRVAVFARTGTNIAKDDPILLSGAVIESLLESFVAQVQRLSDAAVGGSLAKFEEQGKAHLGTTTKLNKEHAENITKFLTVFEATIENLNKQDRLELHSVIQAVKDGRKDLKMHIWLAAAAVSGVVAIAHVLF